MEQVFEQPVCVSLFAQVLWEDTIKGNTKERKFVHRLLISARLSRMGMLQEETGGLAGMVSGGQRGGGDGSHQHIFTLDALLLQF